jgi:hypothetical protein
MPAVGHIFIFIILQSIVGTYLMRFIEAYVNLSQRLVQSKKVQPRFVTCLMGARQSRVDVRRSPGLARGEHTLGVSTKGYSANTVNRWFYLTQVDKLLTVTALFCVQNPRFLSQTLERYP